MEAKKISVALCTYNGVKYLETQLNTLINQTYKNLEIIIVDDGSADGTIDIINEYAADDHRIKLYQNNENLGLIRNFEKAIYLCTGDYIALCDQDDIWMLNKLEKLAAHIESSTLVYHDSQMVDNDGTHLVKISDLFNMYEGNNPLAFIFYNCIPGHTCMFSKELIPVLQSYGPFDTRFYHDWWVSIVAATHGHIKYVNKVLVNYRQHETSATDLSNFKEGAILKPKYAEIAVDWLQKCETLETPDKSYLGKLVNVLLHKSKANIPRLFYLLLLHYRNTYFMKKKNWLSMINYLRKASYFVMTH